MSKRNMCAAYDHIYGRLENIKGCRRMGIICPKNVNSKCEIITPKKVRKIKAWARILGPKTILASSAWNEIKTCPCVILIDEKYLRGK